MLHLLINKRKSRISTSSDKKHKWKGMITMSELAKERLIAFI